MFIKSECPKKCLQAYEDFIRKYTILEYNIKKNTLKIQKMYNNNVHYEEKTNINPTTLMEYIMKYDNVIIDIKR